MRPPARGGVWFTYPSGSLEAVPLLVRHGAAVLARPLAVPGGDLLLVDPLPVPVGDAGVLDLPLLLRPLVLQRRPLRLGVPRRVRDVLRDVGVDVLAVLVHCSGFRAQFPCLK